MVRCDPFCATVDQTGIFTVNKKAQRLWAISQVVKDLTPDDSQYKKAKDTEAEYQTELFLAIKAVGSEAEEEKDEE